MEWCFVSVKAVIFDLDGTLLNTYRDIANAVNFALYENGFPVHKPEMFKIFTGNGTDKMITRALPENHRDEVTLKKVRDIYCKYYDAHSGECTHPYEGIPELLDELKKRGIKIAVVSNKIEFMTQSVIKEYFGDSFDFVTGQCDGIIPKPDTSMVIKAIKAMGVMSSECLYVGDTDVDAQTGKNAGLYTIGVLWGFRNKEELLNNGADTVIEKPCEILKFI